MEILPFSKLIQNLKSTIREWMSLVMNKNH